MNLLCASSLFVLLLAALFGCGRSDSEKGEPTNSSTRKAISAFDDDLSRGTGKVLSNFKHAAGFFSGGALQTDGKSIVVGSVNRFDSDGLIVRINTWGGVDTTFFTSGANTLGYSGADRLYSASLQSDGKILAVGALEGFAGAQDYLLVRFNSNGSLDTTFRTTGKTTLDIGAVDVGYSVGLQTDGKIVLGGAVLGGAQIVRYMTNGDFDTTFNTTGKSVSLSSLTECRGVVFQANGKIVCGGNGTLYFEVARLNTNGLLDTSFRTVGVSSLGAAASSKGYSTSLQTNQKIVIGGHDPASGGMVARFTTSGILDVTFNNPVGYNNLNVSGTDQGLFSAIQTDGKIILSSATNNKSDFGIGRLNSNGLVDTSFNTTGGLVINLVGTDAAYYASIEAGGSIRLFGAVKSLREFGMARISTNGGLDTTFLTTGKGIATFLDGKAVGRAMTIATDGKYYLAGDHNTADFLVGRYLPSGMLDTTFGTVGMSAIDISGVDIAYGLSLQTDGKVVAVGFNSGRDFCIVRLHTNGTLDTTFATSGQKVTDISATDGASAVLITTDGKITAAGFANSLDFGVVRYNTNGDLDTSFKTTGKASYHLSGGEEAFAISLQTDGQVLVGGTTSNYVNFGLIRLDPFGNLDTTFRTTGMAIDNNSSADRISMICIQTDGKMVGAGENSSGGGIVIRYSTNGVLDTSFFTTGSTVSFSNNAYSCAIHPRGKILIGGHSAQYNMQVRRYATNGTLDTTFKTSGTLSVSVGTQTSRVLGIGLPASGEIIVGGWALKNGNEAFAIIKLSP